MSNRAFWLVLALPVCGCRPEVPTIIHEPASPRGKVFVFQATVLHPETLKPAAPQPEVSFSPTDRVRSEVWLAELRQRRAALDRESDPLVRQEKEAEILHELAAVEGRWVTWTFPTRFSADGKAIEIDPPADGRGGVVYSVAGTDYFSFPAPGAMPRLTLGRELDADSFRKLRGGEEVTFRGVVRGLDDGFNLAGRIVEDPFGRPVAPAEQLQPRSVWSGRCFLADSRQNFAIKLNLTRSPDGTISGDCVEVHGAVAHKVTGTQNGDAISFEIQARPGERQQSPYLTTYRGTLKENFVIEGALKKGTFMLFLQDEPVR